MITTTYSFKGGAAGPLLLRLLRRNLPAGLYFLGASFFFFPLQYITEIFQNLPRLTPEGTVGYGPDLYTAANIYTSVSLITFYALMLLVPLVLTLSQMSWLHSRRAVDLYHSLPVGRPALLLANGGAAFLTIAIPTVLNYLVILAAGVIRLKMKTAALDDFTLPVGQIFLDLAGWLIAELGIIAVILLVSTQVGSVFENFAFSAELLCAPAAIILLTNAICGQQLRGYDTGALDLRAVAYSSPVSLMAGRYTTMGMEDGVVAAGDWMLLLWLLFALLILWAAVILYMRRPSELAETSGAREPLNSLGRLGAVYLGGLILGEFFTYVTGIDSLTISTFLGSVLVAVLCQVVLGRGFRDMHRALPGMAAMVAAVTLVALAVTTGGLGYEGRVPSLESTKSVTINYRGRYGTLAQLLDAGSGYSREDGDGRRYYWYGNRDTITLETPEAIALVQEIHRGFIRTAEPGDYGNRFTLEYSGGMKRNYLYWDGDEELFLALEQNEEFLQKTNPLYTLRADQVRALRLSDATGLVTSDAVRGQGEIQRLLQAALADAEAFDFGALTQGTARVAAYLTVETTAPLDGAQLEVEEDCWRSFCLPVYASDKNTQRVMRELGLGEVLGDHSGEVAGLLVDSWTNGQGYYGRRAVVWLDGGPSDLWPTRNAGDPMEEYYGSLIRDPEEIRDLLAAGLGVGYHVEGEAENAFVITMVGKDREGAKFWIPASAATRSIREEHYPYYFEEGSGEAALTASAALH